MRTPVEIADTQLKYYNSHNLDGFCEQFSNDIEIYDLPDNSLRYKGIEEFRKRYKKSFEELKPDAKIVNRIEIGNQIIDHEHVTREGSDEIIEAVAIYWTQGDKIAKAWFLRK